jgi:hypothetical protein
VKWLVGSASIRFLCRVLSLLQCHCLVIYFAYKRFWSSSHYILVTMGMDWLVYVIGIVGKRKCNTCVESVTISYLPYFGTAAPKHGVFFVFSLISSVTKLAIDTVTAKLLFDYQLYYATLSYHLHSIQVTFSYRLHSIQGTFIYHLHGIQVSFS